MVSSVRAEVNSSHFASAPPCVASWPNQGFKPMSFRYNSYPSRIFELTYSEGTASEPSFDSAEQRGDRAYEVASALSDETVSEHFWKN